MIGIYVVLGAAVFLLLVVAIGGYLCEYLDRNDE